MVIEIYPSQLNDAEFTLFTATFFHESVAIAEIKDAPHDVASRWAEAMRDLHGGHPEIKRSGMCQYCASVKKRGDFCHDCNRVFGR